MSRQTSKHSDLTESDIQFIIANTDFDRDTCLKWFDNFKTVCPDLKLDKSNFIEFYSKLVPGDTEEEKEFCGHVFDAVDSDNNEYVDFGEFLVAFWIRSKAGLKEKLTWLFDIYDTDNSNFITHEELHQMLKLVFSMKSISEDPFTRSFYIMKNADRNIDGKLTKQEFITMCTLDEELRELLAPY